MNRVLAGTLGTMALIMGVFTTGCEELGDLTGNGNEAPVIRILGFHMAEIPAEMSDETAIALAGDERWNRITQDATPFYFPTTDSVDLPFTALLANRAIVTPPNRSHQGATRILGGHSSSHPPIAGIPHGLLIDAIGAGNAGSRTSVGTWEVNVGADLTLVGSSSRGDYLDFYLENYNDRTTYATGSFAFIVENRNDPNDHRRWIIFDGEFALAAN